MDDTGRELRPEDEEFLSKLGLTGYWVNDFLVNASGAGTREPRRDPVPGKILVLADLHEPYSSLRTLRLAAEKDGDAERVIVAGDIGDYFTKSRWPKRRDISFKDEVRAVFYRLGWLSTNFRRVEIMQGNHDDRPEKKIARLFGPETDLLFLTEQNLLKRMISFFPNLSLVGTELQPIDSAPNRFDFLPHVYQVNDLVITHAEISRKQDTAILERISQWLFQFRDVIGLRPYRAIAQAHNHRVMSTLKGPEQWYLIPTCSDIYGVGLEYATNSRMVGQAPALGWSTFQQKEGRTIFSSTRFHLTEDYSE